METLIVIGIVVALVAGVAYLSRKRKTDTVRGGGIGGGGGQSDHQNHHH